MNARERMETMHKILIMEIDIRLFVSGSLKDKRSVRKKITDQLKQAHNISVAETNHQDLWNVIGLTIAYVALNQTKASQKAMALENNIARILDQEGSGEITSIYTEII